MERPILARLRSSDPATRRTACLDASRDPSALVFVDALALLLGDPERTVARAVSDALVQIAGHDSGVKTALHRQLRSDDPGRRLAAAFTLARLGPPEPRLIPALIEGLQADRGELRWSAARLLVDAGRLHGEILPIVLGLVQGGATPALRRMAAYCARELAPDSHESAAALLEATRDVDPTVRRAGLSALAKLIDPPTAVYERLIETVGADPDPAAQRIAAVALGQLGAWASPALQSAVRDALCHAVKREDPLLARAASAALERLSRAAAP